MWRGRVPTVKRWALKLTLSTVAGAVVTWAVAWGSALWGNNPEWSHDDMLSAEGWPAGAPSDWSKPNRLWVWRSFGWTVRTVVCVPDDDYVHSFGHSATVYEYGWPACSLHFASFDLGQVEYGRLPAAWLPAFIQPGDSFQGLPAHILPLGFTFNTLLAASIILTLTEGAVAWRRRARRRKGRRPSCGYDRAGVAGVAACPECGRAA